MKKIVYSACSKDSVEDIEYEDEIYGGMFDSFKPDKSLSKIIQQSLRKANPENLIKTISDACLNYVKNEKGTIDQSRRDEVVKYLDSLMSSLDHAELRLYS